MQHSLSEHWRVVRHQNYQNNVAASHLDSSNLTTKWPFRHSAIIITQHFSWAQNPPSDNPARQPSVAFYPVNCNMNWLGLTHCV
jgi:hypothetical protein